MLNTLPLIHDFHAFQGLTLRIVLCLSLHSVVLFWFGFAKTMNNFVSTCSRSELSLKKI